MTARDDGVRRIIEIYEQHPLREAAILARVVRQRGGLDGITELDLAHDSLTELTDRNHVGGVDNVVRMALAAGITPSTRVLDLGAGLGGSARCLAYFFGCRVDGVELSPTRCAEAESLTRRVGLDERVRLTCGDMLTVAVPPAAFDVVWGQGAWMHVEDTAALFAYVAAALVPGGRVVFEEACLRRAPCDAAEATLVERLGHLWGGRLMAEREWRAALAAAGLARIASEDLTGLFISFFERLSGIAAHHAEAGYPAHETEAFDLAVRLAGTGVLGYVRMIAHR